MRVVGYIRVSTARQSEGYSLKLQISKIKEYCKLMDYDLIDIYEDKGISGMTLSKRDGFNELSGNVKELYNPAYYYGNFGDTSRPTIQKRRLRREK